MKKSRFILIFIIVLISASGVAFVLLAKGTYIRLAVAIAAIVALIWWRLYYSKLEYCIDDNTICISSGIFFRRQRLIDKENILWFSYIKPMFHQHAIVTCLHTSNGTMILWGEYSTDG